LLIGHINTPIQSDQPQALIFALFFRKIKPPPDFSGRGQKKGKSVFFFKHTYSPYQYKPFTNLILAVVCGLSKLQKYFLKKYVSMG
jgi:hypothetical protein